ncbi:glycosyltransferase family 4 protein [Derxia gummosa]|uniref:Glycosyltransferase family 4 protein n=1 Tax=Derxia gummosa DSM 723 TaxID=1121388 RepID=A0A8B6X9T3_9BURK|nr:glycosyltransferase family 4 protein [Derxia gummosa]
MSAGGKRPFIYLVCPYAPMGGGMYKVMDYLVQAQHQYPGSPELRILDSRGGGRVWFTPLVLIQAFLKLFWNRLLGNIAGVHVNVAERLSVVRKGLIIVVAHHIGLPVVLHLHAAQLHHFYRGVPGWAKALMRYVFACANEVVVLGHAGKRFVVEDLKVPESRISILINGVPGPAQRPEPRRHDGPVHIVFLGNLLERKGVTDLLNALARPELANLNWKATFAGGGEVEKYRAAVAERGLQDRVSFPGWHNQEQAGALVSTADVLALPSYDEGLPLVILEALGRTTAVLCTPVGEIPDELTDGKNAVFVTPGDVPGIAAALVDLINDADKRIALAIAGRELYEQRYAMGVFFRNVLAIYRRHFDREAFPPAPLPV